MKPLSKHARTVLEMAADRGGETFSGRGGWSGVTMRALESRGLVVLTRKATYETFYRLTDAGRAAITPAAPCACGPSHDCRANGCGDDCEACNA